MVVGQQIIGAIYAYLEGLGTKICKVKIINQYYLENHHSQVHF